MPKIDEQISYNWLFFVLAGAFGTVTLWSVWDETYTRREWKDYQAEFFKIERKLAGDNVKAAEGKVGQNPEYKKLLDEKKAIEQRRKERAGAIDKAKAELEDVQFKFKDAEQDFTFTKSNLEEIYYFYTQAKHEAAKDARKQYEVDHLLKRWENIQADLAAKDKIREEKEKVYNEKAKQVAELQEATHYEEVSAAIEKLEKDVTEAKLKKETVDAKAGLFGLLDGTEIIQQDLADIGRVDRCESCHLGAARGGFEGIVPKHFASHPYRRTLLRFHPAEKFGCTTCHDGQGRATTKFHAHAPSKEESPHAFEKHFWEEPLLAGAFQESNCRKCHVNESYLRAQIDCELDIECPKGLSCGVPSAWTPGANMALPTTITPEAAVAAGEEGAGGGEGGAQPAKKAAAQPKLCIDQNGRAPLVDLAPHLSKGKQIIEEVGCYGCHAMEGFEGLSKPGPDLRHLSDKLEPGWMSEWIRWPKGMRPTTRMPNFFPEDLAEQEYPPTARPKFVDWKTDPDHPEHWLGDQQRAAMVSFLLANSSPYKDLVRKMPSEGNVEHGKELFGSLGCLGCHTLTGYEKKVEHKNRASHFDHGPDLADVGSKTSKEWLFSWLKDPKSYNPESRMPNLRLSDGEAADLAAYLSTQKAKDMTGKPRVFQAAAGINPTDKKLVEHGKSLIKYYGCYGCHNIGGFETTPGIGVELTEFGVKTPDRLDYGDYIIDHSAQTWEKWLYHKLRHPRVYRYERVDTRMPQFDLTDEEIQDVMVVLKGMRGPEKDGEVLGRKLTDLELSGEHGRRLVRWYNCYGCHNVDNFVGDIRQAYPKDQMSFAPPDINGEGMKAQPTWLFGFLQNVITLRPWLTVRMPTFGLSHEETEQLVAMFTSMDKAKWPFEYYGDIHLEGSRRELATKLFNEFKCQQCHVVGDQKFPPEEAGNKAPDLLLAKHRLRADWIAKWLENPDALMPGTRMPAFFAGGANPLDAFMSSANGAKVFGGIHGAEEVRKGGAHAQIELLRDYLMTFGASASGRSAEAPKGETKGKDKASRSNRKDRRAQIGGGQTGRVTNLE